MSHEILLSSLPQTIQERIKGKNEFEELSRKLRTTCGEILLEQGHIEDLKLPLERKLANLFFKKLNFYESSIVRVAYRSIGIENNDSDLDCEVVSFGDCQPLDSRYIAIDVEALDKENYLVLPKNSKDKPKFRNVFSFKVDRSATVQELRDYFQIVNILKENPPEKEE